MSAFVIGLTGPIGAGKSTVAAMLRELGAKVLDADALARDEQVRGTVGYSAIVQTFGTKVLGEDHEIDRKKLAEEVFGDPANLKKLEQILWPRVIARVLEARQMLADDQVLVIEAIKLLESSLRSVCDRVWVVLAARELTLARLKDRGMSAGEAAARAAQQATAEEFREAADVVLENDGDRVALRAKVATAWATARAPKPRATDLGGERAL